MSISLSGSYISMPDTPSAVYPDRLIRPLPKRTLKSRLSSEAAEEIEYPPAVESTSLGNYSQYGDHGEYLNDSKVRIHDHDHDYYDEHDHECDHDHDHDHEHYCDHDHDHTRDHEHIHECDHDHDHDHYHHHHHHHHHHHDEDEEDDLESLDDDSSLPIRRTSGHTESTQPNGRSAFIPTKMVSSGPDGYDAFENTNNKKKRKIPTSGGMGLHQSSLAANMANMGIKDSLDDGHGVGQYYGSGSAASPSGISGAGRGRYGRDAGRRLSGRNPLGPSVNGSNAWPARSRSDPISKAAQELKDAGKTSDQGIISAAIANATALLRKPAQNGQENVSLLEQQSKSAPTNSQFTFTYESDNTKGVTFPEQSLYSAGYAQRAATLPPPNVTNNQRYAAQSTQTSPSMPAPTNQQTGHTQGAPAPAQGKKPRRRRGDIYALQARQRRLQQEYANLHHPPAAEDMWICEFCEYESIFGELPRALIRAYEVKDRSERRKLAEKRRLLEKAKQKGRRGKKQTKNAAKAAQNAAQQNSNHQAYDQHGLDQGDMGLQGDDYLDDGYNDEPLPMPTPPQAPVSQSMPGPGSGGGGGGGGGEGPSSKGGGGGIDHGGQI